MITREEVKEIADLAKISLDGEDLDALTDELNLALEEADIVADAQLDETEYIEAPPQLPHLRGDVVEDSAPVEQMLQNAAEQWDGYFVARRMGGPLDE